MAGFMEASMHVKVSIVVIIVGFIVDLIGFASPFWSSSGSFNAHGGLWQYCNDVNGCNQFGSVSDWFGAVRAFGAIGFIGTVATTVMVVLYTFVSSLNNPRILLVTIVVCFVTVASILLAVLIYSANSLGLDWAWGFCIVAMVLYNVAGVLLTITLSKA